MERDKEGWIPWPVTWSAIWIGTLAAVALGMVIGLIGTATGAHEVARYVDWKKVRFTGLIFSVGGAFFAFVVGGWAAARIAGILRAEPAMLHGAIVWLTALPILIGLATLGVSEGAGGWYGGLSGVPVWVAAVPPVDPLFAKAIRNTALATVVALLVGLVGAVIGGWMASGEPMTFTHYRHRDTTTSRVGFKG